MKKAGIWFLGLIGSIAAHLGILAVLLFAVQPDPVTDQPLPTSELEVQAYQLDRIEAQEQQPQSEQADAEAPDGTSVDAGAIPQSKAKIAQPKSEALRPETTPAQAAAEVSQDLSPVAPANPNATVVAQSQTEIAPAPQAIAPSQALLQATPSTARISAARQQSVELKSAVAAPEPIATAVTASVSAVQAVVRTQIATQAAQPALAIAPIASPQTPVVLAALPAVSAAPTLEPTSASLPVAAPDIAPITTQAPSANAIPTAAPTVATAPAQIANGAVVPVAQPDLAALDVVAPAPSVVPQAVAEPSTIAPGTPDLVAASPQQTNAAFVQPTTPDAKKLKAALAFSGGEGDVDPVSIAAFQSFMQPGDIATSGDQLRDGLSGLLAQVPCSRMQVAFDPDTATLQVKGHIPDDDLRAPVLAALQAQMGTNITVSDNILILPRPQCGALSGIAGVGLPQSTDQITNPLVIGNDTHAKVFKFSDGELLSLDMTAPDYDAYIYLDYFDAEGMVLHLEPNEYAPLRQANAQVAQQIGAKTMQDAGLKLVISPPYGQEIAVAFAASEPLYEGLRPIQEPAAEYLEWLQAQVEKARERNPDFKGEWVYFFVSTAAR